MNAHLILIIALTYAGFVQDVIDELDSKHKPWIHVSAEEESIFSGMTREDIKMKLGLKPMGSNYIPKEDYIANDAPSELPAEFDSLT